MKRILSLALVLMMVFSAFVGVASFAEEEATSTASLKVSAANLEFNTAVYLYIAVDYSEFGSASGITLKVTNNVTGESSIISPNSKIEAPTNCVAFKYTALGAKNMGDELTLQALKDGKPSGDAKNYSILEYALVSQGEGDEKLTNLINAMLAYGAKAQNLNKHTGTYDLSKEYSFTKLTAGAYFADGSTKVIMSEGDAPKTATIAGATDKTCWYNTNLKNLGVGKTLEVGYEKGGQIVYAALGEAFDMRNYTGAPVIEATIGTKSYSYKYADGTTAKRPIDWINSNVLNSDTQRTITYNPGYIEYGQAASAGVLFTHSNFFNKSMYDQVMANGGKFTVSLTMASDGTNKIFDYIGFRAYGSKVVGYEYTKTDGTTFTADIADSQIISWTTEKGAESVGRLYFLTQKDKEITNFRASYNTNGTLNSGAALTHTLTAGEFVTVDIVFDISHTVKCTNGICKGATGKCVCYTCGGKTDPNNPNKMIADGIVNGSRTINKVAYAANTLKCWRCLDENGVTLGDNTPCATCLGDKLCYKADIYVGGVNVGTETFATNADYWQQNLSFELQAAKGCAGKIQSIIVTPFDLVNNK